MKHSIILCLALLPISLGSCAATDQGTDMLILKVRERLPVETSAGESEQVLVVEGAEIWDPSNTALIIVDMWDDHWCKGASKRVAEMAGPLNRVVEAARERGVFVIHSPSTTVAPYAEHPARKRALEAPFTESRVALTTAERWGTTWCWPVEGKEPAMPIDDSDMGCDCEIKCEIREAWSRQIDTIRIDDADAISDNGQEVYNLLEERGIKNVILMGVHLNMCVLGRPFGIRQMVLVGKNVVLVRDLTDTMYNSDMAPQVDHFSGTDLVVEHIEMHWCPSIESTDLAEGAPFRFAADVRPPQ